MSDEFRDYKSDPTSDNLIRLLRAHQDRVYRLCFQVLRRPQDAEDAAQEVLVRIAEGIRAIDDADAFRRWVWRVSLNAALESARKAARRRVHESRAAMKPPAGDPLDEETRHALFESMAKLEDGPRTLLLDHYFEGETLESLASREGVSSQAVSKRLERAREELKRVLPAAFLVLPDMGRLFERGTIVPPPPDLVSGPVLAKVVAVTGGAQLISKSVLVVAAILCLAGGAGYAVLAASRVDSTASSPSSPPPITERMLVSDLTSGRPQAPAEAKPDQGKDVIVAPDSPLQSRLNRFRIWVAEWQADRKRFMEAHVLDQKAQIACAQEKQKELILEMGDINVLILKDPDTFIRFLKDPENEFCVSELTEYGFGFYKWNNGSPYGMKLEYASFPQGLIDGFYELLRTGSPTLKMTALGFFGNVSGLPQEFTTHWTALVNDADQKVVHRSLQLVSRLYSVPKETLEAVFKVGRASPDVEVRREAATAMNWVPDPSAQAFLLERLETVTDGYEATSVVAAMYSKFYAAQRGGPPVDEARFLRAVSGIMNRELDSGTLKIMVDAVLNVPPSKSRPLLVRALAVAPDLECRDAIGRVLQKIDAGETDRKTLNQTLWVSP